MRGITDRKISTSRYWLKETIKEINEAINEQIALGEAAIISPDPERTERLRDRFDRSR